MKQAACARSSVPRPFCSPATPRSTSTTHPLPQRRARAPCRDAGCGGGAGGNGEQSISRDVHRLGTRLDWFRLMSWYHSGIGFFMNSTLTMASVYLAVWLIFFFALTDSLTVRNGNPDRANGLTEDTVVISTINTVQLFQLGLLSVIPLWGELCLETGFLEVRRSP